MVFELFDHILRHTMYFVTAAAGNVRCQPTVRQGVEGVTRFRRLRPGYIEDSRQIGAVSQHLSQIGLHNLCTAAGIQEGGVRKHGSK